MTKYKAKDGRTFDDKAEAMEADICHIIMRYAEKKYGYTSGVIDLFLVSKFLDSGDRSVLLVGAAIEQEVRIINHWVFNNLELLEEIIAFYLDEKVKETKDNSGIK